MASSSNTPAPNAAIAAFKPLAIESDIVKQRDARFLAGGNFFGTETVAPPPLEPLPPGVPGGDPLPAPADGSGPTPTEGEAPPAKPAKRSRGGGKKNQSPVAPGVQQQTSASPSSAMDTS